MAFDLFDTSDADVVLASCEEYDPTEFRVHKCVLAAASPLFYDMFTLPQPSHTDKQIPRISMSETHDIIETLLRFVYPVQDPHINSLEELVPVLGAAVKYDLLAVIASLRNVLISPRFVEKTPTRVYAIASRYDFEEEARLASKYTLRVHILDAPLSDELKFISAYAYHRLLNLHRQRVCGALEALAASTEDIKCMQCNGSPFAVYATPRWWTEFEKLAREELSVRPTTDVIFDVQFLARAAMASGCPRCPGSVFDSWKFLKELKRRIDDLPSTI